MIIKNKEHKTETLDSLFGGDGSAVFKRIIKTPDELYGKGRVFSVVTLNTGCSLGWHIHKGDGEYYHILSGEAEYSDNGNTVTLKAGDTSFCPDGEGHSIKNLKDEPCVFIALVIYN